MNTSRLIAGVCAASCFAWSARSALQPQLSERETAAFRWFNDGPDVIEEPVWALTQAGSLGSVFVAAAVIRRRRGTRDALVVLTVGSGVWAATKLIKPAVGRGRPDRYLDHVNVRGRPQSGLGFPSGHAAVATTLALITTRRPCSRALATAGAALVGCGRLYLGAHLPSDIAGGFAVGTGAALATSAIRATV